MTSWLKKVFWPRQTPQDDAPEDLSGSYTIVSPPGSSQASTTHGRESAQRRQMGEESDNLAMIREESSVLVFALLRKLGKDVVHSRFQGLDSDEAQSMVDFLDKLLDDMSAIAQRERRRLLRLLSEVAQSSQVFPARLNLTNVQCDLNRRAGGGGFGVIYKGTLENQDVCVKTIQLGPPGGANVKVFAGELALWSSMSHPNVQHLCGAYYSDEVEPRLCLVSPWMNGGGLDDYLRAYPQTSRLPLLLDVASGLEYIHDDIGIIHADLKAANVLVSSVGRAVLSDFGLSTVSLTTRNMTAFTGIVPGTTLWMAPELLLSAGGVSLTKPSDMWSFGCVCYEVITGDGPFEKYKKLPALVVPAMMQRRESPAQYVSYSAIQQPLVSGKVWEEVWKVLIERCWVYNPEERPTAADAKRLIRAMGVTDSRPSDEAGRLFDKQGRQDVRINFDRVLPKLRQVSKDHGVGIVRARRSYSANLKAPNRISFSHNEVLSIVDKRGNWWEVQKADGTSGFVPEAEHLFDGDVIDNFSSKARTSFAHIASMSKPAAGAYYIVNQVLSPAGEKLAMTHNGRGQFATATPLSYSAAQLWTIQNYGVRTQSISPVTSHNLQAGWGDAGVIVLPAGGYVWTIRGGEDGYTIQDGGVTVFWGLDEAADGVNINIGSGTGNETQHWILEQA